MQRYELEAWIGDNHGLNEDQIGELLTQVNEIADRYPDPDDQAERDAALTTAYQLIAPAYRLTDTDRDIVETLAREREAARAAEVRALASLQQAAIMQIKPGGETESGFARRANVDRMTVRKWLGK